MSPERKASPRILRVETGWNDAPQWTDDLFVHMLDYHCYTNVPRAWRAIEQKTRFDFYLAWRAKQIAANYDIVWAGSEKVALPMTWLGMPKPFVAILHYPQSPFRAPLLRTMNVAKRWAAVGYVSPTDCDYIINALHIPPARVFPVHQMEMKRFADLPAQTDGPILSLGVAKRDYPTLIAALRGLPDYVTEIFASSRYGDTYNSNLTAAPLPDWIRVREPLSDSAILDKYAHARFVVVPLQVTRHNSAGISVILESGASGKAVIATRTGGVAAYVRDGETGLLVPPGDTDAMRHALETLWNHPALAQEMGKRGREFVLANFHPAIVRQRIREVMLQIHGDAQRAAKNKKTLERR